MINSLRIYKTNQEQEILADNHHHVIAGNDLYDLLEHKLFSTPQAEDNSPSLYDLNKLNSEEHHQKLYTPGTQIVMINSRHCFQAQQEVIDLSILETITYAIEITPPALDKFLEELLKLYKQGLHKRKIQQEYELELQRVRETYLPQLNDAAQLCQAEQERNKNITLRSLARDISKELSKQ